MGTEPCSLPHGMPPALAQRPAAVWRWGEVLRGSSRCSRVLCPLMSTLTPHRAPGKSKDCEEAGGHRCPSHQWSVLKPLGQHLPVGDPVCLQPRAGGFAYPAELPPCLQP